MKFAVVAAVQLPSVSDVEFEASLTELRELAKTLGYKVIRTFTQKRAGFDSVAYLGKGKLKEIRHYVGNQPDADNENGEADLPDAADGQPADHATEEIDALLIDHEISPSQARNLENEIGCEVMDRTMVILEIFHRNARSRAARAQVEIARLGYMAPRLREMAKLVGPQGRQRSGTGGRGSGESHTELDKRKLRDRIAELNQEIIAMEAERKTQRARRQESQGLNHVAIVGYTNAGKSTLMRALTGSEVLVANKLFATLDTTVRALHPETVPRILMSDTVGFIKNLPHGLVASFKSTLDEALDASLLLHVIDASDPGFERQLQVTDEVLAEIEADSVPKILVFNKIDYIGAEGSGSDDKANKANTTNAAHTAHAAHTAAQREHEAILRAKYPGCIVMSAYRREDIVALHQHIVSFFQQDLIEAELFLPWSQQQLRGNIFASCEVIGERAEVEGAYFSVRGEATLVEGLREQIESAT